jgi:hypothetical protein
MVKVWGYYTGFEVLDSIWDANPTGWIGGLPKSATSPSPNACNRDYVIRNNHFIDNMVMQIEPHQGDPYCGGADCASDDRARDRPESLRELLRLERSTGAIRILPGGPEVGEQIADITITNNVSLCSAAADPLLRLG